MMMSSPQQSSTSLLSHIVRFMVMMLALFVPTSQASRRIVPTAGTGGGIKKNMHNKVDGKHESVAFVKRSHHLHPSKARMSVLEGAAASNKKVVETAKPSMLWLDAMNEPERFTGI
mmetsp:Transcript_14100/g.40210  ORF Transcript_14100/g.40210 Transcript_14100/m.40210 type:complete len:116 (+) Transcript_14100:147-494(+)